MATDPTLGALGEALLGDALRRMEGRIMERIDAIALQVTQNAVDREALEEALAKLTAADAVIDATGQEEQP